MPTGLASKLPWAGCLYLAQQENKNLAEVDREAVGPCSRTDRGIQLGKCRRICSLWFSCSLSQSVEALRSRIAVRGICQIHKQSFLKTLPFVLALDVLYVKILLNIDLWTSIWAKDALFADSAVKYDATCRRGLIILISFLLSRPNHVPCVSSATGHYSRRTRSARYSIDSIAYSIQFLDGNRGYDWKMIIEKLITIFSLFSKESIRIQ